MAINWAPTTADEVLQNVRTLLRTEPGTVPLARALGTPQDAVDLPETVVGARVQAAIIKAIRAYEPRAPLDKIRMTAGGKVDVT